MTKPDATAPSLREALREVDAAIAEIIRAEVADPAERERLLAKLTALSQPAASASLDVELLTALLGEVGFMRSCIASGEKLNQTDLDRQNDVMARAADRLREQS